MTRVLALLVLVACSRTPEPARPAAAPDLVVTTSAHDHATTVARAVAAIEERGLVIVHRIDHAAAAQTAGLTLEPATVIVFGNPKAGTPLMEAAPTIALDLPLRLLVWQRDTKVQVAYRAPSAMAAAHGAADHPTAAKMTAVVAAIVGSATR